MKTSASPSGSIPRHDYELALKSAVSWLGDRYLLAAPLPKRWHDPGSTGSASTASKTFDTEHRAR